MIEVFESLTSVLPQAYSHGYLLLESCIESNAFGETQKGISLPVYYLVLFYISETLWH